MSLSRIRISTLKPNHSILRALTIYENALPPDHPEIATTLDNLAQLYSKQGQNAQAKSLFQRALAIKEKSFPPDHPEIAITLFNLAALSKRKISTSKLNLFTNVRLLS